jgi:hypothetical protein
VFLEMLITVLERPGELCKATIDSGSSQRICRAGQPTVHISVLRRALRDGRGTGIGSSSIFQDAATDSSPYYKIILFGERSMRRAMKEYVEHYHTERNHQGKGNVLLFQRVREARRENPLLCRERPGGLLRYYHQNAA